MKVLVFLNNLGIGGTEKAACRWAWGLTDRGHSVSVLTLKDGPRRAELDAYDVPVPVLPENPLAIADCITAIKPDVIHAHAPGFRHEGDVLGAALARLPKIPLVQTNIFGRLENPTEDAWTDFRLFISWTSCVQAARRSFRKLDEPFFRKASVAVYPLDPDDGPPTGEIQAFRQKHQIEPDVILFGRLSRPEPNKWTDLPIEAFRIALRQNSRIKLLLREPPPAVARHLRDAPDRDRFLILPATADQSELRLTMASLDVVLHTSSIGESFGYGIAEPMNYGKPVIANSTPWLDQAQIELVRHGECGFIASTPRSMASAILRLAADESLRSRFGQRVKAHIRKIAAPEKSLDRLETALVAAIHHRPNPHAEEDLMHAREAAAYLDSQQFGHDWKERLALRPFYYRVRFHQWRKAQPRKRLSK